MLSSAAFNILCVCVSSAFPGGEFFVLWAKCHISDIFFICVYSGFLKKYLYSLLLFYQFLTYKAIKKNFVKNKFLCIRDL